MNVLALFLVVALSQVHAQAKKAPPPSPQNAAPAPEPERAKVATEEAGLFESPEMLRRCRSALGEDEKAKKAWAVRDGLWERLFAAKPRGEMTDEEFRGWKLKSADARREFEEYEAKYTWMETGLSAERYLAELAKKAKDVCNDATTARLTEGTLLVVLKRDDLVRVRVESGRATGKVGFVLPESIKPEP